MVSNAVDRWILSYCIPVESKLSFKGLDITSHPEWLKWFVDLLTQIQNSYLKS